MKTLSNKTLSVIAWAVAAVQLLCMFLSMRGFYILPLVLNLLPVVLMCIFAMLIQKDRRDTVTLVLVLVFAVVNLSIPSVLLAGLFLFKRFEKKPRSLNSCWILPSLAEALFGGINIGLVLAYESQQTYLPAILGFIAALATYYILGYWLFNNAADRQAQERDKQTASLNKQLAYYNDLYQQGAITADELEKKKAELEG